MSNGKVLNKLPIAVDYWKLPKSHEKYKTYLYFLTHMHTDHTQGLSSAWTETIYTSQVNRDLLVTMLKVKPELIKPLEIGTTYLLPLPRESANSEEKKISVSLIDANHIRGSVMFLFEGDFGRHLYTGDFRWSDSMLSDPILSNLAASKDLDRLYIDNTFEESNCEFPTREQCMEQVLQVVKKFPYHRIIIGCQQIGKENVLVEIAKFRREPVFVPETVYEIFKVLDLPPDHFITQQAETVLWYEPLHKLYQYNFKEKNHEMPTVFITLTASGLLTGKSLQGDNVFNIPYSNHCSALELTKFLNFLQPEFVERIVQPKKKPTASVIDIFLASKPAELTEDSLSEMSCESSSTTEPLEDIVSMKSSVSTQATSTSVYHTMSESEPASTFKTAFALARITIESLMMQMDEKGEEIIESADFVKKLQTLAKIYRPITGLPPSLYYDCE